MKKICVITGTRAEYGLLKPIITKVNNNSRLKLQLVVTGMHLSPEYGYTYKEIEKDGFLITDRCEMLLSSDTTNGVTKSIGLGIIGFADIFTKNKPDIVIILGDRYEALAAAVAAMVHCIPIAHIHGGELTEGCIDEPIRHAITKMSCLHFASTREYRKRIIQMGEQPQRVFYTGALGVENAKMVQLMSKEELISTFGRVFEKDYFLVTFHPVTLEANSNEEVFYNLLAVISEYTNYNCIFTYANSDASGNTINRLIEKYVSEKENAVVIKSMGQTGYLSALKNCMVIVGNSSSGIVEAPCYGVPTINIGNRQKGRVKAKSVIDCGNSYSEIFNAFKKAVSKKFREACFDCLNPYEKKDGKTSEIIISEIVKYLGEKHDVKKEFYDVEMNFQEDSIL